MISIEDFFSKSDQIRSFFADLVTFTEKILNGKLHFLCNVIPSVLVDVIRNCCRISLVILSEFKRINQFLSP